MELRRIGYQHRGTGASWKCHSETLRKAVFPMLPGISRLRIVNSTSPGFSELLSLTCHVRGLTGLEIHRMRWKAKSLVANIPLSDTDYNSDVGENGTTKNVRLDSLELHNTLSADDCLSSWISPSLYQSVDLEGIRRFHCTGPDAHSALLVLLRSIGGISTALTELKLTIFDIAGDYFCRSPPSTLLNDNGSARQRAHQHKNAPCPSVFEAREHAAKTPGASYRTLVGGVVYECKFRTSVPRVFYRSWVRMFISGALLGSVD